MLNFEQNKMKTYNIQHLRTTNGGGRRKKYLFLSQQQQNTDKYPVETMV